MALSELIARLEQDAQARIDARLGEARAQVAGIEAETSHASAQLRQDELSRRREARRARLEQARAEVEAQARARALRARQALLDRVFARAAALLDGLEYDATLHAALKRWALRARPHLAPGATLRCRSSLAPLLKDLGVELHPDEAVPVGAVIDAPNEALQIDLTAERRLARARPRLSIALAKELP